MSSKIFLLLFMLSVGAAADGEPVDNGTGHLPEAATREKRSDDFPASQVVVDDLAQKVNHHEAEITELKTLVNKLQADLGQRVWLRNGYSVNHDLYGGAYSHFSGFLVQADP
nr:hypothetical protein BaRGS_030716 [Batillaria attramentaria]